MKTKKLTTIFVMLLVGILATSVVSAGSIITLEGGGFVKIDGDRVIPSDIIEVDRSDDLDLKIRFRALQDAEDVRFEAFISGYEHGLISDVSDIDDIRAGQWYTKRLTLSLPDDLDREEYTLRVVISQRTGDLIQYNYRIVVDTERHALDIEDVSFSPGAEVEAGRSLLTTVRVENDGQQDEEVKVTVSIPDLGLSATDYIDEIEEDEKRTSEELFIRIPRCAQPGAYTAEISLMYNDGFDSVTETRTVYVVDGGLCNTAANGADRAQITIGAGSEMVPVGGKAIYPVTITNSGSNTKTYAIEVVGADFATVEISPSNVMTLDAGKSSTAYVFVKPNKGASGQNVFNLAITSGGEVLKQVSLTASVGGSSMGKSGIVKVLEIGLIIIIVILVILGLIVGFNKFRNDDDFDDFDDDEKGQKYY